MLNNHRACLITCTDFHLHQRADGRNYIAEFIKKLGIDCDIITRKGSILDIVFPLHNGFSACLLRDIKNSVKFNKVDVIYIVNHEGCGAYKWRISGKKINEIIQHHSDLKAAKQIIQEIFPTIKIVLCFAYLKKNTDYVFEIKEV